MKRMLCVWNIEGAGRGARPAWHDVYTKATTKRRGPPGGRVQRGRTPIWWGLCGTPPTLYPLCFPPGDRQRSGGESREGAALVGGGLGVPPNLLPLCFPPGKQADVSASFSPKPRVHR